MEEQRKYKRLPVKLELEVSKLFKQDYALVSDINSPIHVFNVSKGGIGFTSRNVLPVGYYFNARLVLGEETSALNCVVRIIRSQENEKDGFKYGCEFVGNANIMDYVFEDYEKKMNE